VPSNPPMSTSVVVALLERRAACSGARRTCELTGPTLARRRGAPGGAAAAPTLDLAMGDAPTGPLAAHEAAPR